MGQEESQIVLTKRQAGLQQKHFAGKDNKALEYTAWGGL